MTAPPPCDDSGNFDRRQFIHLSTMGLLAAGFIPPGVARAADLPPLAQYPRQFFTAEEWEFVLAATARLIPSEGEGPGAIEARVPVFLDRELSGPYGQAQTWYMAGPHQPDAPPELGWQSPLPPAEIYRQAIPLFTQYCAETYGMAFTALDPAQQDQALRALEAGDVPLPPALRDFFTILLANTKEGYLSDPLHGGNHGMAAWVHIGFPGARAQYREWVGRHNIPYPLGPVSISGERA